MRLTRFCSKVEYDKFLSGEMLTNTTDHYRGGKGGSTSVGFCFTTDEPKKAWRYLKGCVDFDVCVVLEIDDALLTRSTGKYADYSTDDGIGTCLKHEYCLTSYSNKNAKLLKILKPEDFATKEEIEVTRWFMTQRKRRVDAFHADDD